LSGKLFGGRGVLIQENLILVKAFVKQAPIGLVACYILIIQ